MMEHKGNRIKIFNTFYWPWAIDVFISIVSLMLILYFGAIAISNPNSLAFWDSILSVFPFLYSANNAFRKINEDRIQRDNFKRNLGPLQEDCQHIFEKHIPESLSTFTSVEKKVLDTHFDDWKKYKNIRSIEYQLLDTYLNNIVTTLEISDGDLLFLKYVLITSAFPLHFPKLVSEIKDADYCEENSPHNEFIRKLYEFTRTNTPLHEIVLPDIDEATIEETINIALNTNSSLINDLLQERKNRQKVDYLLNKCFENAYSNVGDLNLELEDDEGRKIIFLYKYDERFSILQRILNDAIRDHFTKNMVDDNDLSVLIEEAKNELKGIMYPLPFSKALSDFSYCIEKLSPREKFAFIIYPEKFRGETSGWTAQKFMVDQVLPRAKKYLDDFNKRMIREFSFLKRHQKKTLDANYYIFEFNRRDFSYHAAQEAIPETIKRFLIRDILDSDKAGDVVASQLIYLKQVINNLSISGLLFTENKEIQERVRKIEKKLISNLRKSGLIINNIYELISIGNQFELFEANLHLLFHGVELKRRFGNKYNETNQLATTIISNAKELVEIFNSLQAS